MLESKHVFIFGLVAGVLTLLIAGAAENFTLPFVLGLVVFLFIVVFIGPFISKPPKK